MLWGPILEQAGGDPTPWWNMQWVSLRFVSGFLLKKNNPQVVSNMHPKLPGIGGESLQKVSLVLKEGALSPDCWGTVIQSPISSRI